MEMFKKIEKRITEIALEEQEDIMYQAYCELKEINSDNGISYPENAEDVILRKSDNASKFVEIDVEEKEICKSLSCTPKEVLAAISKMEEGKRINILKFPDFPEHDYDSVEGDVHYILPENPRYSVRFYFADDNSNDGSGPTIKDILNSHPDYFTDKEKEESLKEFKDEIETPFKKDLKHVKTWFDFVFDFENGEFWMKGQTKKHSLAIHDEATDRQNHYYAFKVLLENKGVALSKSDLEKNGFMFSLGSMPTCEQLDHYLRKNLHPKFKISSLPQFSSARRWIKYNKETEKITLISD